MKDVNRFLDIAEQAGNTGGDLWKFNLFHTVQSSVNMCIIFLPPALRYVWGGPVQMRTLINEHLLMINVKKLIK